MLNIHYGREDVDKQRFLFESIREEQVTGCTYLVVPDQFTLETERVAFDYLEKNAFIDPIVLSMNRLAGKVLAETGRGMSHIDQYGKYMLLARLLHLADKKEELKVYAGLENAQSFIEKLSDAIMSLKTHMVLPDDLAAAAQSLDEGDLLKDKLGDIALMYARYENALADGIPDSTDIMRLFAESIPCSKFVNGRKFWLWGFDYFTRLQIAVIAALSTVAEVHVVLTAEPGNPFFSLTNSMIDKLKEAADEAGVETQSSSVSKDCAYENDNVKPDVIRHIEQNLFAGKAVPYQGEGVTWDQTLCHGISGIGGDGCMTEGLTPCHETLCRGGACLRLVLATDAYHEAEKAAAEIIRLVTEENLRYRDILVLCNDVEHRSRTIARVFETYGIPVFFDSRREVDHNPVFEFILALPELLLRKRKADDVFRWIATGLTGLSDDDAEELENYTERYNLRGKMWDQPLSRQAGDMDEETFAHVEAAVRYVGSLTTSFFESFDPASTAREKTEALETFLTEKCELPERIEAFADRLEEDRMAVHAQEMRGIWEATLGIFDQISVVLGDTKMSTESYVTVLKTGFAAVRVGVLPAFSDSVTIGTMQRTRTGKVKAMLILGANNGELPKFSQDGGLIVDEEKEALEERGIVGFRSDDTMRAEEQLAIYKNLSKPTRLLYMSYDDKASSIFERIKRLFPDVPVEDDVDILEKEADTDALFAGKNLESMGESIGAERMKALLAADGEPVTISPSSLEKYSRCPFAFAMERAIRLKELRRREIDSRGIGDVYHEALMEFGLRMSKNGAPANAASTWHTADRIETDRLADEIFAKIAADVAEEQRGTENRKQYASSYAALFDEGDAAAEYRRARILSIVKDVYWALTLSARDGGAESMRFETSFREGKDLPPIEIVVPVGSAAEAGAGLPEGSAEVASGAAVGTSSEAAESIRVAGRIDRLDVLPGGQATVVDYKSGTDKFDKRDVAGGWQLQLMIYLRAIAEKYEPRGASYFRVFEPHIDVSKEGAPSTDAEIEAAVIKEYRADGIVFKADMKPEKLEEAEKEFSDLRAATETILKEVATGIAAGTVHARPKKKAGGLETACTYCPYLGICNLKS